MSTDREQLLLPILKQLNTSTNGEIEASAVVTMDGYLLASQMKDSTDLDRFSSMCASLLALADHTTSEVAIGEMNQVMIMGSNGMMVLSHAGSNAVLALSATPKAMQGRVLIQSKQAAAQIGSVLEADR